MLNDDTCHILIYANYYDMICVYEYYVVCDELIWLRYDMLRCDLFEDMLKLCCVTVMIYDMIYA